MTNGRTRTKAALILAVVFAGGFVLGLAASHFYPGRAWGERGHMAPAEFRARLLAVHTEVLGLDEEQQAGVETVLDQIHQRFREVREAVEPEMEAIRAEQADRIMSLLRPDQRSKYEEFLERRRKRREAARGRGQHP